MKNLLLSFSLLVLTAAVPLVLISPKNEYTILNTLNKGVFADVYNAKGLDGELYAVKYYKKSKDPAHEYETGITLDHPSIIKAIETWDHYLILEHAKGRHLCEVSRLTKQQAISISLQLIDAMKYAAFHQYSNTNLQEANVLLNENFLIKIVDLSFFVSFNDLDELVYSQLKHFNRLAELCVHIFDKVPLTREERIEKRLAIKRVVWEVIEDFEEKKEIRFEERLELLKEAL